MSVLTVMLFFVGVLAVAALFWGFRVARARDSFAELIQRRKATATISSMAELVDGGNHIPVALTLEKTQIFYESNFLQAKLEIARLDEVEYDSEQGTGKNVLRLRAHGQTFQFVLDASSARDWAALLPAHRFGDPASSTPSGFSPPTLAPGRT
ncbi:MAG TPA: hypothetical protein VII12_16280 [Thermoanaerobaculia bacterium]|jgi:hypothetical protein